MRTAAVQHPLHALLLALMLLASIVSGEQLHEISASAAEALAPSRPVAALLLTA